MSATPFATILSAARTRHGAAALEARLATPKTPEELRATISDYRRVSATLFVKDLARHHMDEIAVARQSG